MTKDSYKQYENRMEKSLQVLRDELAGIRAGRANPRLLDKISVNYYGTPTPINQLANIAVPEARQITIQPWDEKIVNDVIKAIQVSDLGINPNSDGKIIRLIFPPSPRKEGVSLQRKSKDREKDKVAIRQIRRDAMEDFRKMEKNKEITEDDLKVAEKDIQKITDEYIDKVDQIVETKIKEIMEV